MKTLYMLITYVGPILTGIMFWRLLPMAVEEGVYDLSSLQIKLIAIAAAVIQFVVLWIVLLRPLKQRDAP